MKEILALILQLNSLKTTIQLFVSVKNNNILLLSFNSATQRDVLYKINK